jgi:two-component system sensor histidine kinase UhpB
MSLSYRILHVEDSPEDSELVRFALRGAPFETAYARVGTEPEFIAELDARPPDVVICAFDLPQFSPMRALEVMRERGIDAPFILVSHHIGESVAVIAMQQGASDYLPESDLGRLPKAIGAAIERSLGRRDEARARDALERSESFKRGVLDSLQSRIALVNREGMIVEVNKTWAAFESSRPPDMQGGALGSNYLAMLDAAAARGVAFAGELVAGIRAVIEHRSPVFSMEYQLKVGPSSCWYFARAVPLDGSQSGAVVSHNDVTDRTITHLALGDAHKRLQALSKRTLAIQEEERRAISRELHDDVGQTLAALKIGLHRLAQGKSPDDSRLLLECTNGVSAALERLREMALNLRPPQLDQFGLYDALVWLAQRQRAATGLDVQCSFSVPENRRPSAALESTCYRITQEALNNATGHAKATKVTVSVESDGRLLKLAIRDDGIGFDEHAARLQGLRTGSMGLIGMEERAQLAGGRLELRSIAGVGTTVSAVFPLQSSSLPDAAQAADSALP